MPGPEESELVKTAKLIAEMEEKKKNALSCMENDSRTVVECDQQTLRLVNKMNQMTGSLTYGKPEVTQKGTLRKVVDHSKLEESLGPIVYRDGKNIIRKKVVEYITALPYIDKKNAVRFLVENGYKEGTANNYYGYITKYLRSRGWIVGEHRELHKPKAVDLMTSKVVDLTTATPQERELFVKSVS